MKEQLPYPTRVSLTQKGRAPSTAVALRPRKPSRRLASLPLFGAAPHVGGAGVIGGKFTVIYNWLFIKWLRKSLTRRHAPGFAVQYGYVPLKIGRASCRE